MWVYFGGYLGLKTQLINDNVFGARKCAIIATGYLIVIQVSFFSLQENEDFYRIVFLAWIVIVRLMWKVHLQTTMPRFFWHNAHDLYKFHLNRSQNKLSLVFNKSDERVVILSAFSLILIHLFSVLFVNRTVWMLFAIGRLAKFSWLVHTPGIWARSSVSSG